MIKPVALFCNKAKIFIVRANSLLYAIYICLLVSILCFAMLFYANIYNQLNSFYSTHEEMYIHNQSLVNYALGNINTGLTYFMNDQEKIGSFYKTRQYGFYSVLFAQSFVNNDTVTSTHLVGQYSREDICLYLANYSRQLSYSGEVKLIGEQVLPSEIIRPLYVQEKPNKLIVEGALKKSEAELFEVNPLLKDVFKQDYGRLQYLKDIPKENDSIYFNSFQNSTYNILLSGNTIQNVIVKGNFILHSKDSVNIKKSADLNDVIIIAPKVSIEEGFTGSIQIFATKSIELGENVSLAYPSVVCIFNESKDESKIIIKKGCTIQGGIVTFGFDTVDNDKNTVQIQEDGVIIGNIYCKGTLSLQSDVYGSVYTDKLLYITPSSRYDNCIANIEINAKKRPPYFLSFPLLNKKDKHGLIKKLY